MGEPPVPALAFGKRLAQFIVPGARRPDQARLDLGQSVVGDLSGDGGDDEMHARQGRVADLGIERRQPAGEFLHQNVSDAFAQLGGVAVARHIDETGQETL